MKNKLFFLILFSTFSFFIHSQESLPNGYSNIKLGMSVDETKTQLIKNSDFGYHGDRDVSLLPGNNQTIIETDADRGLGSNFLTQCWFQFNNDKLYIITINMNTDKMDYFSVFTTLTNKYGNPTSLSPKEAVWKNDKITMSLEKPLTLKYIENETFNSLLQYSNVPLSGTETTRNMFLEGL